MRKTVRAACTVFCLAFLGCRETVAPPVTPPYPASNVHADAIAYNHVRVTWKDNSNNESGFTIRRSYSNSPLMAWDNTYANITSYDDRTVSGSTTYLYEIVASNAVGKTLSTTLAIVTTPAEPTTASSGDTIPPSAPTNVQTSSANSEVTITWVDPPDSDLFRIIILRNNGGNTPVSGQSYDRVLKGVGMYIDTTYDPGETYKYLIRAEDTSGNMEINLNVVTQLVQ